MIEVHHLNCGIIESPLGRAACHCLAIEHDGRIALVDAGIGLADCRAPDTRLGAELIELAGFRFDESMTALRQLQLMNFDCSQVTDIILTHADPDHAGGLADFPNAKVHIAVEELHALESGTIRYCLKQFEHKPNFAVHSRKGELWQGHPARPFEVCDGLPLFLVELFGHTLGHCGVIIERNDAEIVFHVGDAYYLRAELDDPHHPVSELAQARAENNEQRLASLNVIHDIRAKLGDQITMTGYHDLSEFEALARR